MDHDDPIPANTILDYWRIIYRYRRVIVCLVVVSIVATGALGKLSTKRYEAKVTLYPAKEVAGGGGMAFSEKERGGGSASLALEAAGGSKSGPSVMEILHAILVSRRMAEDIVNELNLMQYYGAPTVTVAINSLRGETDVRPSPYKTYEVTVLTRDPQMAADIANAYASNLDRLNKELTITATKRNRLFIETRLAEKAKKLEEAENTLKAFQTEHHILGSSGRPEGGAKDAQGPMEAAIALHSDIVSLEVELAALKEYALPSHPSVTQIQAQIKELRRQLDKLEQDEASRSIAKRRTRPPLSQKVYPLVEEAPALSLEFLRLSRQVKIEEAVYGMLVGMLEQAKIAEARDVPTVQVLDAAVVPTVHSRPMTLQNVQTAGALSLILGILLAFFLNYLQGLKTQEAMFGMKGEGAGDFLSDPNGNGNKSEVPSVPPKDIERLYG